MSTGGYHEYTEGCSENQRDIMVNAVEGHWENNLIFYGNSGILNIPQCTHDISQRTHDIPQCTHGIPPVY